VQQQDLWFSSGLVRDQQRVHSPQLRDALAGKRVDAEKVEFHDQEVKDGGAVDVDNGVRRFVTFYFTNFPERANYWCLRKGFEVCGILDDVYVAPRCNVRGRAYGFVRFLKVRDVEKMVQALNNVWFGDFRIWAKVARFKRNEAEDVLENGGVASKENVKVSVEGDGRRNGKLVERKKWTR